MINNSKKKKRYVLYAIINKKTGKYYVGQHVGDADNPLSNYWGSGTTIKHAIKKHGKDAFGKVILADASDAETLNRLERIMVDENMINDPMCYNIQLGGNTPYTTTNKGSNSNWLKSEEGKAHMKKMCELAKAPEAIKKRVDATKQTYLEHPEIFEKRNAKAKETAQNPEHRRLASESRRKYYQTEQGIETKQKISKYISEHKEINNTSLEKARAAISSEGRAISTAKIVQYSKSHRSEISDRMKKYVQTETGKQQLAKAHAAAVSPESRAKQSATRRQQYIDHPELREQMRQRALEIANRPGQREKMRNSRNELYASERGDVIKKKISDSLKRYYASKKK